MKRVFLFFWLVLSVAGLQASDVPSLVILTSSLGEKQIPVASIRKITYDRAELTSMYVQTLTGTQTFALSDVVKMTLSQVPEATALEGISTQDASNCPKIVQNGVVYVIKDGQLYTLKGEKLP